MKFLISKAIPIPTTAKRAPKVEYPFLQMSIGDSIFVPDMNVKKMSGQLSFWKKEHGLVFVVRASTEELLDENGVALVKTGDDGKPLFDSAGQPVHQTSEGVRVWLQDPAEKSNRGRKPAAKADATEEAPKGDDETTEEPSTTDDEY